MVPDRGFWRPGEGEPGPPLQGPRQVVRASSTGISAALPGAICNRSPVGGKLSGSGTVVSLPTGMWDWIHTKLPAESDAARKIDSHVSADLIINWPANPGQPSRTPGELELQETFSQPADHAIGRRGVRALRSITLAMAGAARWQ